MYEAGVSTPEIADRFNRTPSAVANQLRLMGYRGVSEISDSYRCHRWTAEEDARLREDWGKLYTSEIAWELDVPEEAVLNRAKTLGLKRVG